MNLSYLKSGITREVDKAEGVTAKVAVMKRMENVAAELYRKNQKELVADTPQNCDKAGAPPKEFYKFMRLMFGATREQSRKFWKEGQHGKQKSFTVDTNQQKRHLIHVPEFLSDFKIYEYYGKGRVFNFGNTTEPEEVIYIELYK